MSGVKLNQKCEQIQKICPPQTLCNVINKCKMLTSHQQLKLLGLLVKSYLLVLILPYSKNTRISKSLVIKKQILSHYFFHLVYLDNLYMNREQCKISVRICDEITLNIHIISIH